MPSVQAFTPNIALLDNGKLAISYYDFRNHSSSSTALETDRWLDIFTIDPNTNQLTLDQEIRLTKNSFDFRNAPLLSGTPTIPGGYFLGDYAGMVQQNNTVYSAFSITTSTPSVMGDQSVNSADVQFISTKIK